jgi:hypothetical protein
LNNAIPAPNERGKVFKHQLSDETAVTALENDVLPSDYRGK